MKCRTIFKWAGGKSWFVNSLRSHLPNPDLLIEPFVGSASLFLNTSYPQYVLSDINPDLIQFYQLLQTDPHRLIERARVYFQGSWNNPDHYYTLRDRFNSMEDPFEKAPLFLYLNRHGYNGLCRYNRQARYNVPFGRHKKPYFPEKEMIRFAERAQVASFFCEPFEAAFKRAHRLLHCDVRAAIYCDPPYVPLRNQKAFPGYTHSHFGPEQQVRLALCAEELVLKRKVPVLISNHATQQTRDWYRNARRIEHFEAPRRIGRSPASRTSKQELLALYY